MTPATKIHTSPGTVVAPPEATPPDTTKPPCFVCIDEPTFTGAATLPNGGLIVGSDHEA